MATSFWMWPPISRSASVTKCFLSSIIVDVITSCVIPLSNCFSVQPLQECLHLPVCFQVPLVCWVSLFTNWNERKHCQQMHLVITFTSHRCDHLFCFATHQLYGTFLEIIQLFFPPILSAPHSSPPPCRFYLY